MCGRFGFFTPREVAEARFDVALDDASLNRRPFRPRYNIAPGQPILTVALQGNQRRALWQLWGLIPDWARSGQRHPQWINARVETADQKRAFRDAFRRARCLVLASGYYDWEKNSPPESDRFELRPPPSHRPFWIAPQDGAPFAMAGIYSVREPGGEDGHASQSCAILTLAAAGAVRRLHDRMPAVVPRGLESAWLDPDLRDPGRVRALIETPADLGWELRPVSEAVNSPRNEGPELIDPAMGSA